MEWNHQGLIFSEELGLLLMANITNEGFNKMENLKKLYFLRCNKININILKNILVESEKLEYLYLNKCSNIEIEEMLVVANEITKKRTNNITLNIYAFHLKKIRNENFKSIEKSPLLEYTFEHENFFVYM